MKAEIDMVKLMKNENNMTMFENFDFDLENTTI